MIKIDEVWTPIFYKQGNLIIFVSSGFLSDSEEGAQAIGELSGGGVKILTGAEFTGEVLSVKHGQRYVPAKLAGREIAVLSGPAFRAGMSEYRAVAG